MQDAERARERARQADAALARGEPWGPLHGVPMTCKESFDVAGQATTFGSPLLKYTCHRGRAGDSAPEVGRAVLFGKTNVPLWLADFQSYNVLYGTTNNPWGSEAHPRRLVGGLGGGAGQRHDGAGDRLGHRRLGAQSGPLLRRLRTQADVGTVAGSRPLPAWHPEGDGPCGDRATGAQRCGLELVVQATAGPDELRRPVSDLTASTQPDVAGDYRVAVWKNDDIAR